MNYFFLKTLHIVSASFFMGAVILSVLLSYAYLALNNSSQLQTAIKNLLKIEMPIVFTCLLLQPISGFIVIALKHYNPMATWVVGTILTYCVVTCLWLTLLYFQQQTVADTDKAKRYQRNRLLVLIPFLLCVFVLYFFMVIRPS